MPVNIWFTSLYEVQTVGRLLINTMYDALSGFLVWAQWNKIFESIAILSFDVSQHIKPAFWENPGKMILIR